MRRPEPARAGQCLQHDLGGDLTLLRRSCERPGLTLCEWRAANASTSKRAARTSDLSARRKALNAAVRSVARRCLPMSLT